VTVRRDRAVTVRRDRAVAWAAHDGWHAATGCGRAVGQRLNTEFLISAAEFIDISAARVRIF
jgi:hypothetical protein